LLGWVNNKAITFFKNDGSDEYKEAYRQCVTAKYEIAQHERMKLIKGTGKDHIDAVKCLQYITRAVSLGRGGVITVPA